jgi:hypothetical protein
MAQARGVENGTGSPGAGRCSAAGIVWTKKRTSERTPFFSAHASHSGTSTRIGTMKTRLISAVESGRTSALSSAQLPAATTHVPGGRRCSPSRRSSRSE